MISCWDRGQSDGAFGLQEITSNWDFCRSKAMKVENLCFFHRSCDGRGTDACRDLQFLEYCGDIREQGWVLEVRAVDRSELGGWV